MQESFIDDMAFGINSLNFFWGNILSLLQFENVLLSVDDLHSLVPWQKHANISGFQPSIFGDSIISFICIFVVAHKHTRSS